VRPLEGTPEEAEAEQIELHGAVLEGPAELPLRRHAARESEDAILIAVAPMERA